MALECTVSTGYWRCWENMACICPVLPISAAICTECFRQRNIRTVLRHHFVFFAVCRADISELQGKGIYRSREAAAQQTLYKAMLSDQLSQSLRHRPFMYVIICSLLLCWFILVSYSD